ncbi:MAG: nitrile hydratase accessory protein [Paracoccaceae bacterium]
MTTPEPARFDDPWHAQLFALTVAMSEAGHLSWPDWARAFGATLKAHGATGPLDGGADYYAAWLVTLETMLDRAGFTGRPEREAIRDAWETAYRSTPHGKPVRLKD